MGTEYKPLSSSEWCRSVVVETSECFICRDGELKTSDPLKNFCDCKTLLAHHVCLSAWIQRGRGSEDELRCVICKAKYQLQRTSPWRSLSSQWRTWLVLITVLLLMGLAPFVVHCLMTAFHDPSPPITFKVAAALFGFLTELLLVMCLSSYLSGRYRQAERSSFTVQPRSRRGECWEKSEASAAAGQMSTGGGDDKNPDVVKSECLVVF
ncbi:uncharacterized protein LOC116726344 [Xiphophorus hellerii]|uniref:uncharacterized protein LOC116726344 n=1 Tax=Xiphophorus hellerii TaxID=8084 RepID=UPI0013B39D52|nr:uncharacterized protein LOC116726344 [Xiphophorus hellerii]